MSQHLIEKIQSYIELEEEDQRLNRDDVMGQANFVLSLFQIAALGNSLAEFYASK